MNTFIIAVMSLDGKIAKDGEHNSYSWNSEADKKFFVEKTKEAGVVIIGRKTWETINKPLDERLLIVMTRDSDKFAPLDPPIAGGARSVSPPVMEGSGEASIEFTDKTPAEILKDLEARGYKSTAVAGGAQVYSEFLKAGLVDELFLTIEPVIFGKGIDLVSGVEDQNFEIVDVKKFGSKSVSLHARRRV